MTATVYTSSWGKLYQAHRAGDVDIRRDLLPVRISRGLPRFWPEAAIFPAIEDLFPPGWTFGIKEPERFGRAYRRHLHVLGLERIQAQLDELAACYLRPLCLCCFEACPDACHRGPEFGFARWYEAKTNVPIRELPEITE